MKRRFLVIDDDKDIREILKIMLEHSFSADVLEAENNAQAFDYLRKFRIDLITTDIIRSQESGLPFLNKIQNKAALRTIPIIVISAAANDYKALELYRAGVRGVFQKPIHLDQLIAHINLLLNIELNPDKALINLGTETPFLDYKKEIDLSTTKGCAGIAKDIIAMANYGGGTIIIGVNEVTPGKFVSRGLTNNRLSDFEASNFNKKIRKYMSPVATVKLRRVREYGKNFIFLEVSSANEQPIMVAKENDEAGLYRGRIYSRNAAAESAEIQDSAEIRRLIDRFVTTQLRNFTESLKNK
ncbi:MAG: response regulator [Nitrospirae bacterium]|nr:response regulator [Nitrospirota bacterium]